MTDNNQDLAVEDRTVLFQWAYGSDDVVYNGQSAQFNIHVSRGTAQLNWVAGGQASTLPLALDAAQLFTFLIIIVFGSYSVVHLGYMLVKATCLKPDPNEHMRIDNEDSESHKFTSDQKADFNTYYRGSVVVQYAGEKETSQVSQETDEEGGILLSPVDSYKKQKMKSQPLLDSIHREKKAKSAIQNSFFRFLRHRVVGSQFSVFDVLVMLLWIFINVGFLFIWNMKQWILANTFGYLAISNAFFVALPATRNSVLAFFLGMPFDKTILYHLWIGRLVLLLVSAHALIYIISWNSEGVLRERFFQHKYIQGLIAWVALGFVFLSSLGPVRRKLFNFFFVSSCLVHLTVLVPSLHFCCLLRVWSQAYSSICAIHVGSAGILSL